MELAFNCIPVDSLLKEFNCSVCLTQITDCVTTKCGHTFCNDCIAESVNRHHRCPACQGELKEGEYFRNLAMNNLRRVILEEEKKARDEYLQKKGFQNNNSGVEELFMGVLGDHVKIFTNHLTKLGTEFNPSKIENIKGLNDQQKTTALQELSEQHDKIRLYLLDTLKSHLGSLIPNPNMLDTVCTIYLPQRNLTIPSISIQPYKPVSSIQFLLETELKKLDQLADLTGELAILPPEKKLLYKNSEEGRAYENSQVDFHLSSIKHFDLELISIASGTLLSTYQIQPFSTLIYVEKVVVPECITYKYENGLTVNYFSCEDCSTNWICQPCAEYCHKGHTLLTHMSNKKTTWACCYCVKKGLCKAINKDS